MGYDDNAEHIGEQVMVLPQTDVRDTRAASAVMKSMVVCTPFASAEPTALC